MTLPPIPATNPDDANACAELAAILKRKRRGGRGRCGFCPAPDHAIEPLLQFPAWDWRGLCYACQSAVVCYLTPEPPQEARVKRKWNDEHLLWQPWRVLIDCPSCGAPHWEAAGEAWKTLCRPCWRATQPPGVTGLDEDGPQLGTRPPPRPA